MKNNKRKSSMLLPLVLLFAMVGIIVVSGTYAKYSTKLVGTPSTSIAKWSWTITKDSVESAVNASDTTFTIDLFKTVLDTVQVEGADVAETDVTSGKIAPGTKGAMTFTVNNKSEVTGKVSLEFKEETETNIPLEFSTDGNTWEKMSEFSIEKNIAMGESKDYTVMWRWAYERTDENDELLDSVDTALGFAAAQGTSAVKVNATLSMVQVD